ncbi:MAG: glycosyltransferase family 4 protein [Victivallales bacterium]|jgi:UDP-glucose:(heptosyl)LPS alpha-1,3-glucosyltransferase
MKIAVLRKDYNTRGGGAECYAANMCSALLQRGHDVTVFSETFIGETNKDIRNVKVKKSLLSGFSRTSSFHRKVQKMLKSRRDEFDLVFALSRTWPSDVYRVTESLHVEWMKIRYGKLNRLNPRHRGILKLEREIFKPENSKLVVTNSELTKRQAVKNFGFPEDRITVVYNGVDHAKFHPVENRREFLKIRKILNVDDDKFILLFPATNFKIKGLENAIRTISLLDETLRKRTLLLVAGGDREEPYRAFAEKLKVSDNVRFEGRRGNMREYYAAADLLFYPTLYEPFSNVCLEAFSCGLPVLTTSLNGAAEIVKENVSGFIVPDASAEDMMARYIAKFASLGESERAKFSDSAYKTSLNFNWTRHVEQLEKVFIRVK